MSQVLKSQVVVLEGPGQLVFQQEDLDLAGLQPGQVAAETLYSAISPGTEMAAYRGDPPLRPMKVYPRVVGYCNLARVKAVAPAVEQYQPGDLILTRQSHRSAFITTQDQIILKVPPQADLALASTTYLFHLGYNALQRGDYQPGHFLGLVGLGTLGLAALAVAKAFGAACLCFSDQQSSRQAALEMGAAAALAKDPEQAAELIAQKTAGVGLDLVISTSNTWSDWRLALELPRKGGKICVLGFPGRGQPQPDFNPLDSRYFYDKQLSLIACGITPDLEAPLWDLRFTLKRNCQTLLGLIISGALPAQRLISQVVQWQGIEEVYNRLAQREPGLLTCVLQWQ